MSLLYIISYICIIIGLILFLHVILSRKNNNLKLEKNMKKAPNIAIIIPARDESKVIEGLLKSIINQTYKIPSENVYVIVESILDKTVKIVKQYHMNYFVRKKLHLKTKGYAIEELIEDLDKSKKYYDCYFIFDADNILEKDFLEKMLEDYQKGYAVSTGYRALKNKDNYFSLSAGLTFLMVNEIRNRVAVNNHGNLILSGTGYYINGKYIRKWHTFPFRSLTEDYESSLYYALNGISTHYNEEAKFYDEQPEDYKKSITQRSRWIKGYFKNWLFYQKKLKQKLKNNPHNKGSIIEMQIGILPVLFIVLGLVLLLISSVITLGFHFNIKTFLYFILFLLIIYLILVFITAILLWMASKKMTIKKDVYIKSLLYHPIFLISYIHAFLISIMKKNLGWEKITHGK